MILVDTSVWIDFFRGHNTIQVNLLESALNANENICICGVILTEVLQGIRDDNQFNQVQLYFNNFIFLPMEYDTYLKSAEIYRTLRKTGITIRKPVDCMIAATCLENDAFLLHNDKDFDYIEEHQGLRVLKRQL